MHDALTELLGHTRQEEGCLPYDLFESAATPGTFVTSSGPTRRSTPT